jgi:hypothetical protein
MSLRIRSLVNRAYARVLNDRQIYPKYSWGWLNRLVESLALENAGAQIRPQYAWGTVFAAAQARAIGQSGVTVAEFGVAGGRGLVALQTIAVAVTKAIGVPVQVCGFDLGVGLPSVTDLRDMPQLFAGGDFRMDIDALHRRLNPDVTTLLVGPIRTTLGQFLGTSHSRFGFVSIDVDLYSSTVDILRLFCDELPIAHCLPRVACYLDDIMGVTFADITGERLAVAEYNRHHSPTRAISPVFGLRYHLGWPHRNAQWPDMLYWAHFLDHPEYGHPDGLAPGQHAPLHH